MCPQVKGILAGLNLYVLKNEERRDRVGNLAEYFVKVQADKQRVNLSVNYGRMGIRVRSLTPSTRVGGVEAVELEDLEVKDVQD